MKHRIAILSDIHGNTTALEAVIKDAQELGATEYWLMGDILLPGPGRNELFELLSSIPLTATVEEIGMIAFWRLWMGSMVWRTLKKFSSCDLPST